jgi:hypothetical protein
VITTRQYLRHIAKEKDGKEKLRKLFEIAKDRYCLNDSEYWLLIYCFVQDRMRENICARLNIGTTKYASMLNEALIKIEYTIRDLDKIRTL